MGTDLFRISTSRELDRGRYLTAILSSSRRDPRRNVPECLLPINRKQKTETTVQAEGAADNLET